MNNTIRKDTRDFFKILPITYLKSLLYFKTVYSTFNNLNSCYIFVQSQINSQH